MYNIIPYPPKPSWNKGKLVGQKRPLQLEEVWSIRTRLDLANNEKTRATLQQWVSFKSLSSSDYLFGSRVKENYHLTTRQYARIVKN